jgi:hypothetical protein
MRGRIRIEPNERQLPPVVSRPEQGRRRDSVSPLAGQACRFVNAPVSGDQRLPRCNQSPGGDAADVRIVRYVIDAPTVQGGAVELHLIGRRVEQEDGRREAAFVANRAKSS